MGMGITNIRAALEKRYSALSGQLVDVQETIARIYRDMERLDQLEEDIPRLESLIASAKMLLLDAYPDWKPEDTPPIKPWTHHIPIPFGSCGRRGMEVLRKADKGLTTREVARIVLSDVGHDEPDREVLRRVQTAIEASFRKFVGRTTESSGKYPAQWRAINRPDLTFDV